MLFYDICKFYYCFNQFEHGTFKMIEKQYWHYHNNWTPDIFISPSKSFKEAMKLKENFSSFDIDIESRREIIQMGIQKQPRLYRRSRAGVNLFHKIKTVISRLRTKYRQAQMNSTCSIPNIITIELTPKQTHRISD